MTATPLPRDQFPVTDKHVYLNVASQGPLSRRAVDAQNAVNDRWLHEAGQAYDEVERLVERSRASVAALMGCPTTDVAFVKNTTEGLAHIANGLTWHEGDRILIPDREHPSTLYPFLALEDRGIEITRVEPGPHGELELHRFVDELEERPVRLVVVSWVNYATGWRTDLAALADLCHRYGALLCVDAIQGVGLLPCRFAEWNLDFAAAGSQKWMLGPQGAGALYITSERLDDLRVSGPGWNSVADRDNYDRLELSYDDTARRFEGGTPAMAPIAGLGAAADLLIESGPPLIWEYVDEVCTYLVVELDRLGATIRSNRYVDSRSGIVTFTVDSMDNEDLHRHLNEKGVVCALRGGGIRLSPHGYTNGDDVDRLVESLIKIAPTTGRRPTPLERPSQGPMRRPTDW